LRLVRSSGGALQLDHNALDQLLAAIGQVKQRLGDSAPLDPLALLAWPGVLAQGDSDDDAVNAAALALFDQTLAQLIEARAREGAALRSLLEGHLDTAAAIVAKVRDELPALLDLQRQKLRDRLSELSGELDNE